MVWISDERRFDGVVLYDNTGLRVRVEADPRSVSPPAAAWRHTWPASAVRPQGGGGVGDCVQDVVEPRRLQFQRSNHWSWNRAAASPPHTDLHTAHAADECLRIARFHCGVHPQPNASGQKSAFSVFGVLTSSRTAANLRLVPLRSFPVQPTAWTDRTACAHLLRRSGGRPVWQPTRSGPPVEKAAESLTAPDAHDLR